MFRFTIRDILWLTVVVALTVLWWGEYRQRMSENVELRADYQKLEAELRTRRFTPMTPAALENMRQTIVKDNTRLRELLNSHKMRADAYEAERAFIRSTNKKAKL